MNDKRERVVSATLSLLYAGFFNFYTNYFSIAV